MRDIFKCVERNCIAVAVIASVVLVAGILMREPLFWKPAAVVGTATAAMALGAASSLRTFQFTAWVMAVVTTAMLYPDWFQPYESGSVEYKWVLLLMIQAVMFGMGTQISLRDFAEVARQPKAVAIGLACQFTIMPLVGYSLALAFRLPPEIAAGLVLIGSCSSGLSSNVMVYLARANLALSIALTAVATMLAPFITPFWMKMLAGSLLEGTTVEVSFVKLMAGIIKIVVVPTGAALIHDYLKNCPTTERWIVRSLAAIGAIALAVSLTKSWPTSVQSLDENGAMVFELLLFLLGGICFGVIYHEATRLFPELDRWMPMVAMVGILYVTGMTTAEGRENLLLVGVALMFAAALHNLLGYLLGYGMSRILGLDVLSARTVAFEVGLQNGGMATGLAAEMGKLGTLGLPAAFFIAWMNVSGSMLANFWRRRPVASQTGEST